MYITERYTLLKTVEYLVKHKKFSIVQIMPNHKEFLLEKTEKGSSHIVLLNHQTFDWARQMERDIQTKAEFLMRQLPNRVLGKARFHFVYISDLVPVDSWMHLLNDRPVKNTKKMKTSTYALNESNKNQEFNRLLENIGAESTSIFNELPTVEEQESHANYLEQQLISDYQQEKREIKETFQYGKPKLAFILIAINVFVFILIESMGSSTNTQDLIDFGAKYNPAIVEGEWWRIISSMFLHIGTLHLMMNMLALYFLGEAVERIYGSKRFLLIYFFAGIFGGVASFATNDAVAAGASGAIFGLFGALLFFGVHHKRLFFKTMGSSLIIVIGINLVFGFTVAEIDNGAHLGGLVGGFIASQIVHLPRKKDFSKQLIAFVVFIGLIGFLISHGLSNAQNLEDPHTVSMIAQNHIAEGEYNETIELVNEAMANDTEHENLYFYRGVAHFEQGDLNRAEADFEEAIKLDDEFAEAYFNLSIIASRSMEIEAALDYAEKAVELKPEEEEFQDYYKRLQENE